jgi:flagellar motor protein MotB
VDASRLMKTDGADKSPVGDTSKEAGRKLNRRVEIELAVR